MGFSDYSYVDTRDRKQNRRLEHRRYHSTAIMVTMAFLLGTLWPLIGCQFPFNPLFNIENPTPWQEDLEEVYRKLPKDHANMFKYISSEDWRDQLHDLGVRASTMAEDDVIIDLMEIIASIGASHTGVMLDYGYTCGPDESGVRVCEPYPLRYAFNIFPLALRSLLDGYWVTECTPDWIHLIGQRLVSINGTLVEEIAETLRPLLPEVNESYFRSNIGKLIIRPEILRHYGFSHLDQVDQFEFDHPQSGRIVETLEPVEISQADSFLRFSDAADVVLPLYLQEPDQIYWTRWLPESKLYYICYRKCTEDTDYPVSTFIDETLEEIASSTIDRIVIDLRENKGGSYMLMQPLFRRIVRDQSINKPGALFLVTGIDTFSSAVDHIQYFQRRSDAILIGESPASKPYHGYGELGALYLSNSGVRIIYSTYYNWDFFRVETDTIIPDIEVVTASADYFTGLDPVLLEYILDSP